MSINDMKISELYKKLKSEFPPIVPTKFPIIMPEYCGGVMNIITFHLSQDVVIRFHNTLKYERPYDIVKNFHLLNDFLTLHGFKREINDYNHIFFDKEKENIYIEIDIYEILLIINSGDNDFISKNFDKIYDLIDYLKVYFDLQNKVAIRE